MTIASLVVTKGHRFPRDAFYTMFDELPGVAATHVEHPAAQLFFTPEHAARWDAFVLYDMPGFEFRADRGPPRLVPPSPQFVAGFQHVLEAGHGFVFLHHALAGWPAWEEFADIIGGRFHYSPSGQQPDSGYRLDVRHRVSVERPDHPVVAGLGDGFDLDDELYLADVHEDQIEPLLRSDFEFVDGNFFSAALAVAGWRNSREGWSHPRGSDVVAWVRPHPTSRIVYIQPGDGEPTFANPAYRRLLANAITWVAGAREARVSGGAHSSEPPANHRSNIGLATEVTGPRRNPAGERT